MIVIPKTAQEHAAMAAFLSHYAGVVYGLDTRAMGWVSDHKLVLGAALNGFMGKVAQVHVAMDPNYHFVPRTMLTSFFEYAFETCKLELLLGVVNSANAEAVRFDEHLGFRERHRIPGMHDGGGDIVLFEMSRADCRYLPANASLYRELADEV